MRRPNANAPHIIGNYHTQGPLPKTHLAIQVVECIWRKYCVHGSRRVETIPKDYSPSFLGGEFPQSRVHPTHSTFANRGGFGQRNNKLVWDETVRIIDELFTQWGSQKEVAYQHTVDLTLPVSDRATLALQAFANHPGH